MYWSIYGVISSSYSRRGHIPKGVFRFLCMAVFPLVVELAGSPNVGALMRRFDEGILVALNI